MNIRKLLRTIALLIIPASLLVAHSANAQTQIELPESRIFDIPRAVDVIPILDLLSTTTGMNSSVSISVENGVTKINASENGIKTYIEDDPNVGITVKITRQYGTDQMELLEKEHPDLHMQIRDFPEESEGAQVEVNLNITKTYQAESADDLKENHPIAFEMYDKYANGNSSQLEMPTLRLDRLGIRGGFQLIRPEGLRGMGIEMDDIRIHDSEEDSDEDSSSEKDESKSDDKDT